MKLLRSLISHRYFLSMEFFKRSILSTFPKKPLRSSVFYRYFLSVELSRGPHVVNFDETLEKLDLISIVTNCEISQKSTLSTFSMKLWRSLNFHRYFPSVEIFQRSTLSTFSMKPLRSSVFHRYFLSVEFFRGLHLVHFDGALEKFDPSPIFPESGIFRGPHLNKFSWKLLISSDFHRCFLNVDFFRGSHLVYFDETLEKFDPTSWFSEYEMFQRSTLSEFRRNSWEVWFFIDIF